MLSRSLQFNHSLSLCCVWPNVSHCQDKTDYFCIAFACTIKFVLHKFTVCKQGIKCKQNQCNSYINQPNKPHIYLSLSTVSSIQMSWLQYIYTLVTHCVSVVRSINRIPSWLISSTLCPLIIFFHWFPVLNCVHFKKLYTAIYVDYNTENQWN